MRTIPSLMAAVIAMTALMQSPLLAGPNDEADAGAALALAKARVTVCKTTAVPVAPVVAPDAKPMPIKRECYTSLAAAQAEAKRLALPLVLWVGMTCEAEPELRDAIAAECVMCHLAESGGSATPRVLVSRDHSTESMYVFEKGKVNPVEVRNVWTRQMAPNGFIRSELQFGPSCANGQCPQAQTPARIRRP
jgi:hypothetical protein